MPYSNQLLNLQTAVITRLTATDAFVPPPTPTTGNVTWLSEVLGDIANKVAQATAKIGIMGLVLTPGGERMRLRDPKAGLIDLVCPILIEIQENEVINQAASGTQIHALDLVIFCMKRLNFWDPKRPSTSDRHKLSPTTVTLDPKPFELVNVPNDKNPMLVYHVRADAPLAIL